MAYILHGSCSMSHSHGGHGHSHASSKLPAQYRRIPSNKHLQRVQDEERCDGLANSTADLQQQPTFNGGAFQQRSDSVCSHRSPTHSRTNSFSKTLADVDGRRSPSLRTNSFSRILNEQLPDHHNHKNYRRTDSGDSQLTGSSSNEISDVHFHHRHDDDDHHQQKNINIQAAVIHVIGDFIQSIGVFIAAVVINYYVSI